MIKFSRKVRTITQQVMNFVVREDKFLGQSSFFSKSKLSVGPIQIDQVLLISR